jgi:hypothetical protein
MHSTIKESFDMSRMLVRIFSTFVLVLGLFFARGAAAIVNVDLTTSEAGPVNIGDSFDVDVLLSWDGAGSLIGIFSSTVWDSGQLMLTNAEFPLNPNFETRPVPLKGVGSYIPELTRFGTIESGLAGDDLDSTARTVQYGTVEPLDPSSAKTDEVIVRLTFLVVGAGDGVAEVTNVFLNADAIANDTSAFGPPITMTIPEPGSALLAMSSLASVFAVAVVRRRRA